MFVKTKNDKVSKFPYTIGELCRENSNTSFPKVIPENTLQEYGVYKVTPTIPPTFNNRTHSLSQSVKNVDGTWQQAWTIKKVPEDRANSSQRAHRNQLLAQTDYFALTDVTMNAEMTSYRQALRDITDHEDWPYIEDAWPTKP